MTWALKAPCAAACSWSPRPGEVPGPRHPRDSAQAEASEPLSGYLWKCDLHAVKCTPPGTQFQGVGQGRSVVSPQRGQGLLVSSPQGSPGDWLGQSLQGVLWWGWHSWGGGPRAPPPLRVSGFVLGVRTTAESSPGRTGGGTEMWLCPAPCTAVPQVSVSVASHLGPQSARLEPLSPLQPGARPLRLGRGSAGAQQGPASERVSRAHLRRWLLQTEGHLGASPCGGTPHHGRGRVAGARQASRGGPHGLAGARGFMRGDTGERVRPSPPSGLTVEAPSGAPGRAQTPAQLSLAARPSPCPLCAPAPPVQGAGPCPVCAPRQWEAPEWHQGSPRARRDHPANAPSTCVHSSPRFGGQADPTQATGREVQTVTRGAAAWAVLGQSRRSCAGQEPPWPPCGPGSGAASGPASCSWVGSAAEGRGLAEPGCGRGHSADGGQTNSLVLSPKAKAVEALGPLPLNTVCLVHVRCPAAGPSRKTEWTTCGPWSRPCPCSWPWCPTGRCTSRCAAAAAGPLPCRRPGVRAKGLFPGTLGPGPRSC